MRRFSTFARVSLVETITIDDLDRQLTQCLGVDGRASFSAIADVLGVSDQTVARRYRRLRSAGVLRVVGLKYPKSAGYANWFLRLRCVPGSGEAIAAALAQRSDTAWVQLLSGDTEVLCSLRGDASDGTESLLTRLPRSGRIVAVTAYSRLHMFTGGPDALGFMDVLPASRVAPLHVAVRTRPRPTEPQEPASDLDAALFSALALDGRTPYADIAAAELLLRDDGAAADGAAPRDRPALLRPGARHADLRLPVLGVALPVGAALAPGGRRRRAREVP